MLLKQELEVAARMHTIPQINHAIGLAMAGELQRAGHMIDDYLKHSPDSDVALFAKRQMLGMMGEAGQLDEAARLARQCARTAASLWGSADMRTLIMRNTELYWTGQAGLQSQAERLAERLMVDGEVVLGRTNQLTYAIRNNSARIFEQGDNYERSRGLYLDLLADFDASDDPVSEEALTTRHNYAEYLVELQEYTEAMEVYQRLLLQIMEVWGTRSESALETRHEAAQVMLLAGSPEIAVEQWEALYADCRNALGLTHHLTAEVINHLVAVAAHEDDYRGAVKWLGLMLKSLGDCGSPELLRELSRMKNRYSELMREERAE